MNKKILTLMFGMVFLFMTMSFVSAETESIGTFKQNEDIELYQTCSACDSFNLTQIKYPNSTTFLTDVNVTKDGTYYYYILDSNYTTEVGTYTYCYSASNDIDEEAGCLNFEITLSGKGDLSSGGGLGLLGSLGIIVLISVFFFVLSTRVNHQASKISLMVLSSIFLLVAVFYSMVTVQQTLGGYEALITGYSTFFLILKILAGIAITALSIFALLVAVRWYRFKRGIID